MKIELKVDFWYEGIEDSTDEEEIEEVVKEFKKKNPWFEIYYATVEKRYC